jgi:ABC-2 type transport system ATP-binding protein
LELFNDLFSGEILGKNKYIRELSKGNQKKVGIAASLLFNPEILILDEPFPHLDPSTVIRLKNLLIELKKNENATLLISSHDLNHVTDVCDRIVLLEKGLIVKDITTETNTLKELEEYFAV